MAGGNLDGHIGVDAQEAMVHHVCVLAVAEVRGEVVVARVETVGCDNAAEVALSQGTERRMAHFHHPQPLSMSLGVSEVGLADRAEELVGRYLVIHPGGHSPKPLFGPGIILCPNLGIWPASLDKVFFSPYV